MSEENTPTEEPQEAVETPTPRLLAKVGRIEGALIEVGFTDGEDVKVLIERADLTFSKGMEITDDSGEDVDALDKAVENAVYWISGNYQNGQQ